MKTINVLLCSIVVLVLESNSVSSTSAALLWSRPQRRLSGDDNATYSENSKVGNHPKSGLGVLDTTSSLLHLRHKHELDEDGGGGGGGGYGSGGLPNLSAYHVRFETCQVEEDHHYGSCPGEDSGSDGGDSSDSNSCIETRRHVVFRLCSNACLGSGIGSANACCSDHGDESSHGEYMADLGDYLEAVVAQYQEEQKRYCKSCKEDCKDFDAYKPECSNCIDECYKIENMEEMGYIDAAEFIQCQMIYDGDDVAYFAGPICSSDSLDGAKIKIGVFLDEQCTREATYRDVEDYLVDSDGYQLKLSHNLLRKAYTAREDEFLSCHAPKEVAGETSEGCQVLQNVSAKCDSDSDSEQDMVCGMIAKLKEGPIVNNEAGESPLTSTIKGEDGRRRMTGRQKLLLVISSSGTFVLAVYAIVLRRRLAKTNVHLSAEGEDLNLAEIAGPHRFRGSNQYTPVVLAEPN